MSNETQASAAPEKALPENITMSDGRIVAFPKSRNMIKTTNVEEGTVTFDFSNGETRTFAVKASPLALQFALHGVSQKIGDESAGIKDVDDMVVATDDIIKRLNEGQWGVQRQSGSGFSGASVVIKALIQVTGKSIDQVKAFLDAKLAATPGLTRAALYASFRASEKVGPVIEELEKAKVKKASPVNADDLLGELA